jgi:hypothetical protein
MEEISDVAGIGPAMAKQILEQLNPQP